MKKSELKRRWKQLRKHADLLARANAVLVLDLRQVSGLMKELSTANQHLRHRIDQLMDELARRGVAFPSA